MSEDISPYDDIEEAQIQDIMELLDYSREEAEFITDMISAEELEVRLMRVRIEKRWENLKTEGDALFGDGDEEKIIERLKHRHYSKGAIAICCVREVSGLNRPQLLRKLRKVLKTLDTI